MKTIREKLVSRFSEIKWQSLDFNDLDTGFMNLSNTEKQTIADSLKYSDDRARSLIKNKLQSVVDEYAKTQADFFIGQGNIDIDTINLLLKE